MEGGYSGTATNEPAKKTDYFCYFMFHKVALCKHVTLPYYTLVWVNVVTKISVLIQTEPGNSL